MADALVGVEAELSVDDDAIDVDLVRGGHGEDLVGLHDLVVLGKVEEGAGDAPCQHGGFTLCGDLLVVDAEDEEVVAELLADGLWVGHLFKAEVAPPSPEVDDDRLFAEEFVEADHLAIEVGEHEVGSGVPDIRADLAVIGVVGYAEVTIAPAFFHDFRRPLEGVGQGQDNSGNTGQADGEDYPLLEQGESLYVSPISTSMITHGGRGRISNSSYLRGTPFERRTHWNVNITSIARTC